VSRPRQYPRINALTLRAAFRARREMDLYHCDRAVIEELQQAAWVGLLEAIRKGHRNPGYLFTAAWRQARKDWIISRRNAHITHDPASRQLAESIKEDIFRALYESRKKKGSRGLAAAAKQAYAMIEGAESRPNAGIALDLGITEGYAKVLRVKGRKRLARHFEERIENDGNRNQ